MLLAFIWAPVDDGYEKIPVSIIDDVNFCGRHALPGMVFAGCNYGKSISLDSRFVFTVNTKDCLTSWDHEAWHSFGYSDPMNNCG